MSLPPGLTEPTCDSWLSVVRPHLSPALISPRALRRLRTVARQLPGDCTTVLETRLTRNDHSVDLSLRLIDAEPARALAARVAPPHLKRLLDRWSRRVPELEPVRAVWLEHDLEREPRDLPEPVVCVELGSRTGRNQGLDRRWLFETLLPALLPSLRGMPPSASRRRRIDRCLDAIPAPAELLYVFGLGARGSDALRLELHRIEPAAMAAYLETVGAADAARRVAELTPLVAGCDRYHLSFDLGAEIAPRIGIEASFRGLPEREPGWSRIAGRLVARGLATPEKRDALFAWPGYDTPRSAADRWPASHLRPGVFCARCLSHFKLVSRPDREVEAKAYLLFQPLEKPDAVSSPDLESRAYRPTSPVRAGRARRRAGRCS